MSACPEPFEWHAAMAGNELNAGLEAHLDTCAVCRRRYESERSDLDLSRALREVVEGSHVPEPYELLEELFRGGQAVVWRAHQVRTGRVVALKLFEETDARGRHRFERELELAGRLNHPSIVAPFDAGDLDGRPYLVMELVEGVPLDQYLGTVELDLRGRLELFLQVADPVAHAHRRGVVHRDLKPRNVLVEAGGRPRLVDFGIAAALGPSALRITATGAFLGTLAYASPEQLRGERDALDTRSDVYSLGVMLFELLAGELPHDVRAGLQGALGQEGPARDPRSCAGCLQGVDDDLAAVVAGALEREQELRYPSVEALERDVRRWLAQEPVEIRPPSTWKVLRMALARRRREALAAALVLLVVGSALGLAWRSAWRSSRDRAGTELVGRVLQDVLAAAAPDRMGGDVRLVEVLQLLGPALEDEDPGAPDVLAAVQATVGETFLRLMMMPEAETALGQALQRLEGRGIGGERRAEVLEGLAIAKSEQSEPGGIALAQESLELRREHLEPEDPRITHGLRTLGHAYCMEPRADHEHGVELLRRARADFERRGDRLEVAATDLLLARTSTADHERIAQVLAVFEELAPMDPRVITALGLSAMLARSEERWEDAELLLVRAGERARQLFGEAGAADMLRREAQLCFERGDLVGAEDRARAALAFSLEQAARRRHPGTVDDWFQTVAQLRQGDAPPYGRAFGQLREALGEGAYELISWANALANILAARDRVEESEGMLRTALTIHCRSWGEQCPLRQEALVLLGDLLRHDQRCEEARPFLEESLAIAHRRGAEDSEQAERARLGLVRCREGTAGGHE